MDFEKNNQIVLIDFSIENNTLNIEDPNYLQESWNLEGFPYVILNVRWTNTCLPKGHKQKKKKKKRSTLGAPNQTHLLITCQWVKQQRLPMITCHGEAQCWTRTIFRSQIPTRRRRDFGLLCSKASIRASKSDTSRDSLSPTKPSKSKSLSWEPMYSATSISR